MATVLLLEQTKHEGQTAMTLTELAERNGTEVEIVNHSDVLMELGGVGCLLRYPPPEDFYRQVD